MNDQKCWLWSLGIFCSCVVIVVLIVSRTNVVLEKEKTKQLEISQPKQLPIKNSSTTNVTFLVVTNYAHLEIP